MCNVGKQNCVLYGTRDPRAIAALCNGTSHVHRNWRRETISRCHPTPSLAKAHHGPPADVRGVAVFAVRHTKRRRSSIAELISSGAAEPHELPTAQPPSRLWWRQQLRRGGRGGGEGVRTVMLLCGNLFHDSAPLRKEVRRVLVLPTAGMRPRPSPPCPFFGLTALPAGVR